MAYENEVIKYFRRRDAVGFNQPVSWIGAEQRFVGPLRNSNLNNLEEQYILGTDTYTVFYKDEEGNDVIEKSFCAADDIDTATNYYKLISTVYIDPQSSSDIYFGNDKIVMTNKYEDVIFGNAEIVPYSDPNSVYFLNSDKYYFNENNELVLVCNEGNAYMEIEKDQLTFVKEDGMSLAVSTKVTETKMKDNKKIVRERIINYLK